LERASPLQRRIGIRHDLADEDGSIYLRVDRLERIDPPAPSEIAKDWPTVCKDPFREPAIQSMRAVSMLAEEVDGLVAVGIVDPEYK